MAGALRDRERSAAVSAVLERVVHDAADETRYPPPCQDVDGEVAGEGDAWLAANAGRARTLYYWPSHVKAIR